MEDNSRKKLYDHLSASYDLGTFEEFDNKMGNDSSRRKLYDKVSEKYNIGTYEEFNTKMGNTHKQNLDAFNETNGAFMDDFESRDSAETKASRAGMSSGIYIPSQSSITGEERQKYNELYKQEEALKKAWYNSADYLETQGQTAVQLAQMRDDIDKGRISFAQANPVLDGLNPYATRGADADAELQMYETASRIMDETIKLHNAPSRYDGANAWQNVKKFGKGAKDKASDVDLWTAGLTEISDNLGVRSVLQKVQDKLGNLNKLDEETIETILSPAEKAVLQAWSINAQEQLRRQGELSRGYQAGQGAVESLGYMAEFALTGGVGKAATEGVEAMTKWLGKKALTSFRGMADDVAETAVREFGEKAMKTTIGKYGARLGEALAETAGKTMVMPSTFRNITEKATEIETDSEGNNYLVGMNNAFARGFADSFIENLSEGGRVNALGEMVGDLAGKIPAYKRIIEKFSNTKASELLKAFNSSGIMNTLRAGGWHGFGEEYLEEWYGNALRTLTGLDKNALKDFATVDNQIVTITSFLPMTIFGGTVSTAQVLSANRHLEKKAEALKSALLERGYDEKQAANMIDMMRGASPAEISNQLAPIVNSVAFRNVDEAAALMKPVGEFAEAVQRWQSFDTKYKYQEQEQRDNLFAEMEQNLGQFWMEDENGNKKVLKATNANGEVVYLLGKQEASEVEEGVVSSVPAITAEGKKVFVNPMEYKTSGELDMNAFLGTEIMAEKNNKVVAEELEKREKKLAEIRSMSAPGVSINLGTTEAPIQATVTQRTPDGVIVMTPDGQTRQLTTEEFGNYIGINATPLTEEQRVEQEASALSADKDQRDAMLDQEYENLPEAERELVGANEEIEESVEVSTPLPTKADGSVDQTALWNESPERWASWNDEQRQDGGLNSLAYINSAIANESARIAELQAGYNSITDFEQRDAVDKEISSIRDRLETLVNLREKYSAQAEAVAQAEQANVAAQMTEEEKAEAEEQRREPLRKRAQEWSEKLGVKVNIAENFSDVKEAKARQQILRIDLTGSAERATGWYNPKTNEVTIYIPHTTNLKELDNTFVHEVVAHLGLRGLLGEEGFNVLCDSVWDMMSGAEQLHFLAYPGVNGDRRAAADEYMAFLSENLDIEENKSLWDRIVAAIQRLLMSMGFKLELSQDELSNIILASYRRLKEGAKEEIATTETTNQESAQDQEETTPDVEETAEEVTEETTEEEEEEDSLRFSITNPEENLSEETKKELADKGLVMEGGVIMSEDYAELKHELGYETPIEQGVTEDDIRFSVVTMPGWRKNYLTYEEADERIVNILEAFAARITANELVNGVIAQGAHKSSKKTKDGKLVESGPLRSNISYVVTFDLDTSCPRTFQYLNFVRKIERRIGRPMTQIECIQLNEMMRMYGQQMPCVYCYAENKRQAMKQYFNNYIAARRGVLSAETDAEALKHMYGHEKEGTNPKTVLTEAAYKVFKKWRKNPKGTYNPSMKMLWNQYDQARNSILSLLDMKYAEGAIKTDAADKTIAEIIGEELRVTNKTALREIEEIVVEWKWNTIEGRQHDDFTPMDEDDLWVNENALEVWRDMTLYAKSASGAKNVNRYVPYTDELKNVDQATRDYINGMGGLRMHSTNDFRIDYVFDYFQFLADMAAAKMFGHTYTKSPEFVRIFGGSGYKINMSIAAYQDEKGNIRPNVDEGFDWNEAKELRRLFPHAGTMLMATSDEQLQMALDSDWIDMCIPFHHSGLPKAVWYNMRLWTDYTTIQNERYFNNEERIAMLAEAGVEIPKRASTETIEEIFNEHFKIKVEIGDDGKRVKPHFLPGPTIVKGVKIPGHNNDHKLYLELCKQYGVKPRFEGIKVKDNTPEGGGRIVDISEHPRYMILVKETARTDTPQTAIQFNFDQPSEALGGKTPMDYAFEELEARAMVESELAGGKVKDIYNSLNNDQFGIVDQFLGTIIKHKEETGEDYPMDYLTPESREWFLVQRKALEEAFKDIEEIPYHRNEYDEQGNLVKGKGLEREESVDLIEEAKKIVEKEDTEKKTKATKTKTTKKKVSKGETLVPGHKKGESMVPKYESFDTLSFRITKNTKATIEGWCDKAGIDEELKEDFVTHLEYTFDDSTEQLCAAKWYLNGSINLPNEDEQKVRDAVKVAKQHKVDAFSYSSPMEILNTYGKPKGKQKPINPDTVPTLTNKVEVPGTDITLYDVDESEESRKNMREIINTHYGKDSSPWCLLQGDEDGNLIEYSESYWKHYSATKKRVAFLKGRLLAFSATTGSVTWWDRNDIPHDNIPVVKPLEEDALKRKRQYEYSENGEVVLEGNMFKGNKRDGKYIEWEVSPNYGVQISRIENRKNGRPEGLWQGFYSDGSPCIANFYEKGIQVSAIQFGDNQSWASFVGGPNHMIKVQVYFSKQENNEVVITDYTKVKGLKLIGKNYFEGALAQEPKYKALAEYYANLFDRSKPGFGLKPEDAETTLDTVLGWMDQEQNKSEVSFRITPEQDKTYMDAVKAGDMETAQRMVIEAARLAMPNTKVVDEDGNPKVVYHGTGSEFYTFRDTSDSNELGAGYYFSDSYEMAERYATDETLADNRFRAEALAFEIFTDEMGHSEADYDDVEFTDDYNESYYRAIERLFGNGHVKSVFLNLENPRILSRVSPDFDPTYRHGFNHYNEGVMAKRFNDGIIDEMFTERHEGLTGNQYVAFSPSQIKSADPVTYDDAGNVIPLSERFNPENEDIRFSIRSEEQREKLFADAKAHYGVTKNFNAAGFMLPDGSLLDFSEANDGGDPNSRSLDHRDIEGVIMDNGVEYDSRWMYIADFMKEGAIRLLPESAGINMIQAPTEEQRKKIFDFIYKYNGEVILEINDQRLNSVAYMEYNRRTSPSRIFRDIDGYFNDGIVPQQTDDLRFSIVGERGAMRDKTEEGLTRLDNLEVARQMETELNPDWSAKEDENALKIKVATGWERGADGKWRYEVDDVQIKPAREWIESKKKLTLKDIVEKHPIFDIYPDLLDIKIVKDRSKYNLGAHYVHSANEMKLPIGALKDEYRTMMDYYGEEQTDGNFARYWKVMETDILHELQHAIQSREGFAEGGSPSGMLPEDWATYNRMYDEMSALVDEYNDIPRYDRNMAWAVDKRREAERAQSRVSSFYRRHRLGEERYRRLAGEVEAYNTKNRRDMTSEERRNSLLASTEDVARKDQIFIMNAVESTESSIRFRTSNDNQAIFVSNAAKAVEGIKQEKATPEQWLKMIEKAGGLKAGEDKWMGLSEWLKASDKKTLTKQEVLDFINENMIIIDEQHYGEFSEEERERALFENLINEKGEEFTDSFIGKAFIYEEGPRGPYLVMEDAREAARLYRLDTGKEMAMERGVWLRKDEVTLKEWANAIIAKSSEIEGAREIDSTRKLYSTEGLENKHEIALTVPTIEPWKKNKENTIHFEDAGEGRAVAWIRFGDAVTEDDNRVLVVDEIQSARHQEGREKGYANMTQEQYSAQMNEKYDTQYYGWQDKATPEEWETYRSLAKAIPAAPFENNWHELAMKRMLRYAAENGYDHIAWTTGDQQAERYKEDYKEVTVSQWKTYDTTKKRSVHILFNDGGTLDLGVNDEGVVTRGDFVGENLSEVLGKEFARKILSIEGEAKLSGEELDFGEGMKGFYDKMLPSFMNKYGKKWGVKVEDIDLPNLGKSGYTMHSVPVTEEMKASVMEGQVMFRMRGSNESAREFMQDVVNNEVYANSALSRVQVANVDEATAKMFGYTLEKLKKVAGNYSFKEDLITIFAHENVDDSDVVLNTLYHEAIHRAVAKFVPDAVKVGELLWNNADIDEELASTKADILKNGYKEDEWHEEMLCEALSDAISAKVAQDIPAVLPNGLGDYVKQILDKIGYGKERKRGRISWTNPQRKEAERSSSSESDRGIKKEDLHESRSGLSSAERRVINEYFPLAFRMVDSNGNTLTPEQEEFFANSKAVDKDGNLLALYHGTPRAGFTEFKSGWFTTSKEDAISYSGDRKGRLFDPNEKYEPETLTAGDFRLGYMTFDSEEDRAAFLERFPYANEVMSEEEYESARLGADEEYDALTARRKEFAEVWNAYREYERERFVDTTIGDLIANPEAYTEDDLRRAMLAYDSNANFDSLDDMDAAERKDALVSALQNANEEAEGEILDMVVATRVPRNGEGQKHNDLGNRTYEVYANIEKPYEIDANGRGSEFESGDIYKSVEEALADEQYDGVIIRNWRVGRTQQLGDVVVPKNGGQIKLTSNENPTDSSDVVDNVDENGVSFRVVTDQALLDQLNNEEYVYFYRAMQRVDGKLYPPMAGKTAEKKGGKRKWGEPAPKKAWLQSDEMPWLAIHASYDEDTKEHKKGDLKYDEEGNPVYVFVLDKGNGKSLKAAYNPYIHASASPLNDQFSEAQSRGNIVIVKVAVPKSELTSGYKAEKAKDSVGIKPWHKGPISGVLAQYEGKGREVMLTRYARIEEILTDSQVADEIVNTIEGTTLMDNPLPTNVFTPGVRAELEKRGFLFVETTNKGEIKEGEHKGKTWASVYGKEGLGKRKDDEVSFRVTGTPTDKVVTNGLRLTPAQTAELAGNIFAALPEENRKKITEGLGSILGIQNAIMQIPTSLATKEDWDEEDKKIANIVASEVTKMAGEMTRPFSASEGLWLLYNELNPSTDLISAASRALVQRNLGFDAETLAMEEEAKNDARFRIVGDAFTNAIASLYNRGASNVWTRLKESFVDMNASVEELVKAIEKASGKKAEGFENILLALNQQSSKGHAAVESYEQKFLNPMMDVVRKIMKVTGRTYEDVVRYVILKHGLERNEKMAQRDAKAYYQEIYDEIIAKINGMNDAQKRTYLTNAQLRSADAKAELARLQSVNTTAFTEDEMRKHKRDLKKAKEAVTKTDEELSKAQKIATLTEADAQKELEKIFKRIENKKEAKYSELRKNDYSGISSMFYRQLGVDRKNYQTEEEYQAALMQAKQDKYAELKDIETAAQLEVEGFENEISTTELWDKINAATKETLRQQYESNMISKEQYDNLRNMYEYYVPLRGFKDNTAEDMYTYYRRPNSTGYTKPILGAEGRSTEAESPFGWIAAMAGSAIASNVKNEAKLALYYFVANRPDNGIATLSKTWYVHTPGDVDAKGKRIFRPSYPEYTADMTPEEMRDAHNTWLANMKDAQKQGLAYESGQRLNLGNSVVNISDKNKPEHVVNVKIGGKDYSIFINGNPRAAQAINGDLNIEGTSQDYSKVFGPVLRWMSSVNTSYNPEFWITNMMRDMAFTWMAINTKEDPAYRKRFGENYRKALSVVKLNAKREKGTLGNSYLELAYKEFVEYGGLTGYTQIKDSEAWEKEIEKYIKDSDPNAAELRMAWSKIKECAHVMHRIGESLEQVSRFAAFLTSREMGKSMSEAIADAKEITVNFNRKGSGKWISFEEAKHLTRKNGKPLGKVGQMAAVAFSSISPLGRRMIMFFNASIQGLNATYQLAKKNPSRFTGWALAYAAFGMMNAVIHSLVDDDDQYLDIPQYERRTNLMLGANGIYIKWALPQEAKAFYALGDLAVESIMGRNPHQNALGQTLKIVSEVLPINPSEGWRAALPSVLLPFAEIIVNEDYKGDPIYNEQKWLSKEEKKRTAKWSSAYDGTGKIYKDLSQALNYISGGDKYDAGWINLQPEKMEHLVQSAFGGTIRTADKLFNTITAAIDPEEEITVRQFPFLNRFLTITDERFKNVHVNDVYDFYAGEAEHAISLEKKYKKSKDSDSLRKLKESDEYKMIKVHNKYKKSIDKLQEKIRAAEGTSERKELMRRQDELKQKMIKEISDL